MIEHEVAEHATRPARSSEVAFLPTHILASEEVSQLPEEHRQCTICIEDFQAGDKQKTLPCFHRFHASCVDEWLGHQGTCPICKHRTDGLGVGAGV